MKEIDKTPRGAMQTEPLSNVEANFRHREIDVGEVRLHVVEVGAGKSRPLVILLHGFPEFWWSWRRQMRALADAGFHVVAPDMRGYNLSEKPRDVSDYRMEHLTGDVRGLIRACGAPGERAVVIGHDWGGLVAWEFAMAHPEMLLRLGILNMPYPAVFVKALRRLEQLKKSWYILFFQLPGLPEKLLAKNDFEFVRKTFAKDGMAKAEIDRYVEAISRDGAARGAINYYRASLRAAVTKTGPTRRPIDAPVLVVWGAQDSYLGRELANPPARWVPNARVEFVPGASHWVQHDAPERVNELLLEFIGDLKTGVQPS